MFYVKDTVYFNVSLSMPGFGHFYNNFEIFNYLKIAFISLRCQVTGSCIEKGIHVYGLTVDALDLRVGA